MSMKYTFTHEQITALKNLIIIAEDEQEKGSHDAENIILQQSIEEVKKIIDVWDSEEPRKIFFKKGWHWTTS